VPYKGSGPGLTDLSAGRLAVAFSTALSVVPFVKGGRLRAIAVTSSARSSFMPDLPTVAESGLSGYEAGSWYGVVAPAGTPRPTVSRLHAEIVKVLALPDMRDRLVSQGIDPVGNTHEQFAVYMQAEIIKWAKIIKSTGVTAE
jgi:tripartite-type tricarboxylate transporter receptor subunit TctC